ncbi:hypothetical protein AWZ03_007418 [Drosophila navojoa]|uniref:Protein RER1 n=1 Tax=Drosophila navojoa TaxID=7232 RepID=A0A484BDY5_DRONA|nr:protein RER1 [Drosophila navojoa]TDG46210.1 hypothetical protein AWZ03_007418 [Drosophila navojoa]
MMNEDSASTSTSTSGGGGVKKFFLRLSQIYQSSLDRSTPHTRMRWVFAGFVLLLFVLRIFIYQGWYIVCYALGIYHLNLFIAFLTPKIDPEFDPYAQEDDEGPNLPRHSNEEFRPFIRRLPEFKFWLSVTKSTAIGLFCTFFDFFNVPVFWPILVMYFITLFCITMKRQIKHMIKYKYLPFTRNKPRYQRVSEVAGGGPSIGGASSK